MFQNRISSDSYLDPTILDSLKTKFNIRFFMLRKLEVIQNINIFFILKIKLYEDKGMSGTVANRDLNR